MLYRSVLYRSVLFRSVVYRYVVYRSVVYRSVLYRSTLYRSVLYRSVLYRSVLYRYVVYRYVVYRSVLYRSLSYRITGDVRVNEQPGLTSMHTLWVREHNRIVDQLVIRHGYTYSTIFDREILFQEARRIVVAEYQVGLMEWQTLVNTMCTMCVLLNKIEEYIINKDTNTK